MRRLGATEIGNLTVYEGHKVLSKPVLPSHSPPCSYSFALEPKPDYRVELRPVVFLQCSYAQLKLSGREVPKGFEAHVCESEAVEVIEGFQAFPTPKPNVHQLGISDERVNELAEKLRRCKLGRNSRRSVVLSYLDCQI